MRKRIVLGAATLVALLGFAGCGGNDAESTRLSIVGGEVKDDSEVAGYAFEGNDVASPGPTIRVRAGQRVTISFKNTHGQYFGETYIPHNLVVTATKDEQAKPLWKAAVGETEFLDVGQSGSVTFTPDAPGSYFYLCTVFGRVSQARWVRPRPGSCRSVVCSAAFRKSLHIR